METVQLLLGRDANQAQIEAIYDLYKKRLKKICQDYDKEIVEIPEDLEFILTEATIARYNRIGSEGMKQESFEGFSATYGEEIDQLEKFKNYIYDYFKNLDPQQNSTKGKIRFI